MQTFARSDPFVEPVSADVGWLVLYRTGAAAAVISAILIPLQIAVRCLPPPIDGTVADWFALLNSHRLAGLIDLD